MVYALYMHCKSSMYDTFPWQTVRTVPSRKKPPSRHGRTAGSSDELLGTLATGPRTQLKTNEPTDGVQGKSRFGKA